MTQFEYVCTRSVLSYVEDCSHTNICVMILGSRRKLRALQLILIVTHCIATRENY